MARINRQARREAEELAQTLEPYDSNHPYADVIEAAREKVKERRLVSAAMYVIKECQTVEAGDAVEAAFEAHADIAHRGGEQTWKQWLKGHRSTAEVLLSAMPVADQEEIRELTLAEFGAAL